MLLDRYSQSENISPVFISQSSVKELEINIRGPCKLFVLYMVIQYGLCL